MKTEKDTLATYDKGQIWGGKSFLKESIQFP